MPTISKLVQMKVCNLGCIGPEGLVVVLDEIVCLVGPNNCGKTTVLRAYEAAVSQTALSDLEFHDNKKAPVTVELWVHIPEEAKNVDAKWKEPKDGLLLVRSIWTWEAPDKAPVRKTWDPTVGDYAADGNAAGLDEVFTSRLPQPFRIASLQDPEEEHQRLLKLVLEPVIAELKQVAEKPDSDLQTKIAELKAEANKPLEPFKKQIDDVSSGINKAYQRVFGSSKVAFKLSLGDLGIDIPGSLTRSSSVAVTESSGDGHWSRQGTGSQRALFWSMLQIRSELKRVADHKTRLEKQKKT